MGPEPDGLRVALPGRALQRGEGLEEGREVEASSGQELAQVLVLVLLHHLEVGRAVVERPDGDDLRVVELRVDLFEALWDLEDGACDPACCLA